MQRVVIFGATGQTGFCVLSAAVKKGLDVRIFVRDVSKVPEEFKNKVEIVVGDVLNGQEVSKAVSGRDAVIVTLGNRRDLGPTTVLSQGTKNIVESMKAHKVELISACISGFLFYKPEVVPSLFKDITADHQRMFDVIKESGLKWICVFPPQILDTPSSKYKVTHNESAGRVISKHDLATFLVECLEQPEHYQQVCGIATVQS